MFNKIKKISSVLVVSAGLVSLSAAPASAFFGFSFGMDNSGPFMMFNDGGRFWHFNMNHPFGRYGSNYGRRGYGGYGRYYNQPMNNYYGPGYQYNNLLNRQYSQRPGQWRDQWPGQWRGAPRGYNNSPWNNTRQWGRAPWGGNPWNNTRQWSGNRWGGNPMGYGMNPMSGYSPFSGSPFGGMPFRGF